MLHTMEYARDRVHRLLSIAPGSLYSLMPDAHGFYNGTNGFAVYLFLAAVREATQGEG